MPHVPGHTPGTVVSSGGTYQPAGNIAGNIVIGSPTSQSGPTTSGPREKLKKRKKQALQNLQINPNYVTGVVQDAQNQLDNIVKNKNKLQNQAGDVIINPNVAGDLFKDYKPGDKLNSAQQVIYDFYASSTPNKYQQELQKFITTSPLHREVYKQSGLGAKFNLFMTEMPEKIIANTGIGRLITAMGNKTGAIKNAVNAVANAFNPEQAANLNINQEEKSGLPALLKKENIIKGDATPIDPQFAPFLEDSPLGTEGYDLEGDTPSTVYNPETADAQNFDYMAQALRDFDLYKKNLPSNQIADEVETETEDTVPGTIDLIKQDDVVLSGDPNEILDTKVDEDEGVVMPSNYAGAYPDPSYLMQENLFNPLDNQPYINKTFDYDPTVLGGDENIPPGTVFSPAISNMRKLGQEIQTFPGQDPLQNAKGGIATLDKGGQAGGGKLTAPSMRDLMGVASLMGINPATLSTKGAILPMLSESGMFEPDFLSMNKLIFDLARARNPNERITTDDIQQAAKDISGPNLSNRDDSGYARMSTFEKLKMMADSD